MLLKMVAELRPGDQEYAKPHVEIAEPGPGPIADTFRANAASLARFMRGQ
jgi:hypothetical protein